MDINSLSSRVGEEETEEEGRKGETTGMATIRGRGDRGRQLIGAVVVLIELEQERVGGGEGEGST